MESARPRTPLSAHAPCPDGAYLLFIDNEHCGSHLLPKPRRMHKRKDGRKSSSRPRCARAAGSRVPPELGCREGALLLHISPSPS